MRQLRGEGDHPIVRRARRHGKGGKARGREQVFHPVEQNNIIVHRRHDHHGRAAEHIRPRVFEAGIVRARHRVPAHKREPMLPRRRKARAADHFLGAAQIHHDVVLGKIRRVLLQESRRRLGIGGDEQKIAPGILLPRERAIQRAAQNGELRHRFRGVVAVHGVARLFVGFGHGTADQAQPHPANREVFPLFAILHCNASLIF